MEIEEDTTVLPNEAVKQKLNSIAKKYFNSDDYSFSVERGSSKGDNYIGVVYRVTLKCNNNNQKDLSIIIKVPPLNESRRKQFFARPTFLREAYVYDEIIPTFLQFQKNKGIIPDKQNGLYEIPKCLGTLIDDGTEAIFLEDLREKGFQMFNRLEKITVDHVKLVMKILGKLHAVSFAMKDQIPEKFSDYKKMEEIFLTRKDDENLKMYFDSLKNRAMDTLSPSTDKHLIDKMNNLFGDKNYMSFMLDILNGSNSEPYSVLCHGDCWNNNVLYKYKDKIPVEAHLIDWQITRYASPVCDITYFIFGCTTKELRDKHYYELIDTYYRSLADLLQRLGSDPNKLFPKEALDNELKQRGCFGLLMAIALLPIFTAHIDDIPDLDELSEKLEEGNVDPNESFSGERSMAVYVKRMRDVIIDIVDLGYM